jgi:hypothetical protein
MAALRGDITFRYLKQFFLVFFFFYRFCGLEKDVVILKKTPVDNSSVVR